MREFGNHRAQRFDLASQLSIFGNQFLVVLLGLYELSAQRLDIWGNGSAPDGHLEAPQVLCRFYTGCGSRLRVA